MSDLVGNPEDRFSRVEAQLYWLGDETVLKTHIKTEVQSNEVKYLDYTSVDRQNIYRK